MRKPRSTVLLAVSVAGALVIAGFGVIQADEDQPAVADAPLHATMTAFAGNAPVRRATAEAFLSRYNSGELDHRSLRKGDLPITGRPFEQLPSAVGTSDAVLVAEFLGTRFLTGDVAEMPVSIWSLQAATVVTGDVAPAGTVEVAVPGGPIRSSYPDLPDGFGTAGTLPVPVPGDRLLLFLESLGDGVPFTPLTAFNVFTIRNGIVIDDEAARVAGIAGRAESEIVRELRNFAGAR